MPDLLSEVEVCGIIAMAWQDDMAFEAIAQQLGLTEPQVMALIWVLQIGPFLAGIGMRRRRLISGRKPPTGGSFARRGALPQLTNSLQLTHSFN